MEFINVLDNRGVYGDGIHDDTKALQNCIDTLKSGGTIYFPDGVYLLSATLRVTRIIRTCIKKADILLTLR